MQSSTTSASKSEGNLADFIYEICPFLCMYSFAEEHHVVPDALLQELVGLRTSFASFLFQFEQVLRTSPGAQETFVGMLQGILLRTFASFKECFDTLIEEEVSLFNITYLKQICTQSVFPENVR